MDKQEFFLLIPAIVYGVAIVDLLKIFQHRKNYWETIIWGAYIFMAIVLMWTELFMKLEAMTMSIGNFFLIILQAILLAQIIAVITPEEKDVDTRHYFLENRKKFFLLIASAVVFNYIIQFLVFDDQRPDWVRPTGLTLNLVCAFWDNIWIRTGVWTFFFSSGLYLIFFS